MKLAALSGVVLVCVVTAFAAQPSGQTSSDDETITLMGCLDGDGSAEAPWVLRHAALPVPPPAIPAGRGGRGAGRGRGRGAPPPPPPDPEIVDLRLDGLDLAPWRGMRIAADGMLGPDMGKGLREFHIESARSVWGVCN